MNKYEVKTKKTSCSRLDFDNRDFSSLNDDCFFGAIFVRFDWEPRNFSVEEEGVITGLS